MDILLFIALIIMTLIAIVVIHFDREFVQLIHKLLDAHHKLTEKEVKEIMELKDRVNKLENK